MTLRCESCDHWLATDRAASFAAPCAVLSFPGRVAFDQTCDKHSSKVQPAPPPQDQSQWPGVPVQMWKKP